LYGSGTRHALAPRHPNALAGAESLLPTGGALRQRANKNTFFLSFPQEVSGLHSFYTVRAQIAVALIFVVPQSAFSQKREMF
jgi:hypothetical protein